MSTQPARRPTKSPPIRPYIQWRWVMEQKPRKKSMWHETFEATSGAIIHANDHHVLLNYITPTRKDGKICKSDVDAYIAAGKPEDEVSEPRYPNRVEISHEECNALMHVTQQMGRDSVVLYKCITLEMIDGVRTPVSTIWWGVYARRSHAKGLRRRDSRFGILPALAAYPWGKTWGARW